MTTLEEDKREWERLISEQDEFVARLLRYKDSLERELSALKAIQDSPASNVLQITEIGTVRDAESRALNAEQELETFKEYASHLELENDESKLTAQENIRLKSEIEALKLSSLKSNESGGVSNGKNSGSKGSNGTSSILVLIDGSSAPFADNLVSQGRTGGEQVAKQVAWEVEKDLRAFEYYTEFEDDNDQGTEIIAFVFFNKAVLLQSLLKAGVFTSPATFDAFIHAFNDDPLRSMVDVGNASIDAKIASYLNLFGSSKSVKRIYLAGVDPGALYARVPNLEKRTSSTLAKNLDGKIVTINHRESESDRAELLRYGYRVTTFSRFFSTNGGVGGDWGFRQIALYPNDADDDDDSSSVEGFARGSVEAKGSWGNNSGKWATAGSRRERGGGNGGGGRGGGGGGSRDKFNPHRGYLNQEPKICVFHFLAAGGCRTQDCPHSHTYTLTAPQIHRLREDVRGVPCKQGGSCAKSKIPGEGCIYNHGEPRKSNRAFAGKTRAR